VGCIATQRYRPELTTRDGRSAVAADPRAPARAWILGLPKAEVHLHLEGCLPAAIVAAAAARHGSTAPAGWRDGRVAVTSLAELLTHLDWSCALIDRPEELRAIARALSARASASGTRHVDVIMNPAHWGHWRRDLRTMIDALDAGFADAAADGQATAGLCVSLGRHQSATEADELVDEVLEMAHPRVLALSIDGNEAGGSHNERFAGAFARAGAAGLRRCAHAGESSGPASVREAIELLGAERIDHGVRCIEDPALVDDLVERRIPLDICPTSNVVLGVAPDWPSHPLEALRRAGVLFSINTDDPLLYGIDLAGEYERSAAAFGWGEAELATVAHTSIVSCFAPEARRAALLDELEAFIAPG
jgi:adenosine deaminase